MLKKAIYIAFIIMAFFSCKKNEEQSKLKKIDYTYQPINIGSYIMYDVTEINIDKPISIYDTLTYQLKELIESSFIGSNGKIQYRIERYIRNNDTLPWQISDVWSEYFLDNKFVKVEENIPYIKINFPIELDKSWDGNKLNYLDSSEYLITKVNESEIINNINLDSVITITSFDEESLIDKKSIFEKYSKNIGLVEKVSIEINSQPENGQPIDITIPIENRITTGKIYKQQVFDYKIY